MCPMGVATKAIKQVALRLVLDGAICLADSFEFTIYHCQRLKALDATQVISLRK